MTHKKQEMAFAEKGRAMEMKEGNNEFREKEKRKDAMMWEKNEGSK